MIKTKKVICCDDLINDRTIPCPNTIFPNPNIMNSGWIFVENDGCRFHYCPIHAEKASFVWKTHGFSLSYANSEELTEEDS